MADAPRVLDVAHGAGRQEPTLTELKGLSVSRARALAPGTQPTWITTKDTSNHGCLSKGPSLLPQVDNPSGTYRL